jgi:cellulose synthase/poly-beta-1,6-N-acetylglucosamine synthase-like glycosyltransferase
VIPDGRVVTIVVPARNEASVLPSCLSRLLFQDYRGTMHVIVSANGCDDGTAELARAWQRRFQASGHWMHVLELGNEGRAAALNAADALAIPGIRVYLDADVVLSPNAISEVARLLRPGSGIHLAGPSLRVAPNTSFITRCYGQVWSNLPYIRDDVIGRGFYAVSEQGRRRWRDFPRIISDDKFVRLHFRRNERAVAPEAYSQIQLPEGLSEMVRARGRWCRGNRELSRMFPALAKSDRGRYRQLLPFVLAHPRLWPHMLLFAAVFGLGELAAFRGRGVVPTSPTWPGAEPPTWTGSSRAPSRAISPSSSRRSSTL